MKLFFLLLFIGVPLAEIAVFIQVGERISIGATIALVILTAVIGVALLKRQGIAALARAREATDKGELPVESVVDGICLLVAGAFLLTPGFITDTAGFLLLVPALRHGMARRIFSKIRESGSFQFHTSGNTSSHHSSIRTPPDNVIEAESRGAARTPRMMNRVVKAILHHPGENK